MAAEPPNTDANADVARALAALGAPMIRYHRFPAIPLASASAASADPMPLLTEALGSPVALRQAVDPLAPPADIAISAEQVAAWALAQGSAPMEYPPSPLPGLAPLQRDPPAPQPPSPFWSGPPHGGAVAVMAGTHPTAASPVLPAQQAGPVRQSAGLAQMFRLLAGRQAGPAPVLPEGELRALFRHW